MRKLIALLALAGAAVTAALFFWRRKEGSWASMCSSARDTTCSWGKTVADEAGKAGDTVVTAVDEATNTVAGFADEIKEGTAHTTRRVGNAAKKESAAVAEQVSNLADEVPDQAEASS
jgi:hypothetical protein